MKFLAVKNFADFQHYRDRNPPWIKLYARLLTDLAFLELPEAAQAQLMKLWILASQMGNPLPNNPRLLAGKIGTTGKFHLAVLIDTGFLIPCNEFASTDDSKTLDNTEQNSSVPVYARSQSELEDHADEREGAAALTALNLTIWCNTAVTERWGESPNPYIQVNAIELAEELGKARVEAGIARLSIYRQCRESRKDLPPRGQNYFRRGILDDWAAELARRAVVTSGERPPERIATVAPKEHWKDRNAREAAEERAANEFKHMTQLVGTRRAKDDGDLWWARMQREANTSNAADLYRYASKHLEEPGRLGESAA